MNKNKTSKIKKNILTGALGLAIATTASMSWSINTKAAENNLQNKVDVEEIETLLHYTHVSSHELLGGFQTVHVEDKQDEEYMIIYLTDISEDAKAKFMKDANIPQADNIIFKQCSFSYKELCEAAKEAGDSYSHKELYKIINCFSVLDTCSEEEINAILNNTEKYNNTVNIYIKESNYENVKKNLETKYADKIACFTQKDYNILETGYFIYSPDVNEDGKSDLQDAQMILKGALKIDDLTYNQFVEADMDFNDELTLQDARTALQRVLKIQ